MFRLENVPNVVVTPPLITCTDRTSKAVVVVVSAVSICSQNVKVAVVAVEGMVTVWVAVSVCVVP